MEKENKKNNKLLIAILIIVIAILGALCILFATGVISYMTINSETTEEKESKEEETKSNLKSVKVLKEEDKINIYLNDNIIFSNDFYGTLNYSIEEVSNIYIVTYYDNMAQQCKQIPVLITTDGTILEIPCESIKDTITINNEEYDTDIRGLIINDNNELEVYKENGAIISYTEDTKIYGYKYTYKVENNELIEIKKEEITKDEDRFMKNDKNECQ